ncbi:MAG TPA: hypothetical protein VK034_19940 [Enhygromyxa sp.]|nr:hypothetical protein [Enhygromyxa sp.]
MSTITRSLVTLTLLFGLGCDAEHELDSPELAAVELEAIALDAIAQPDELDGYGWTELPAEHSDPDQLIPPPANGVCGGYWENKPHVDWQGCGTCTHNIMGYERDGNLGLWWRRWCWTGVGCTGCEPWVVFSTQCYDNCG